ncbi:MAG: Asp-tRNA(Asn)/Glu-tRNA(Gln) amidotransferase subunit GatC [Phycisphaera sp.]|nr:MAG: Asp-tRNA(Asn)/Glu-tRNA(Gln) amidotransferase subunit GatC [Phycisphaera sp.]
MSPDAPPPVDVRKIARLARLGVAQSDLAPLAAELASILDHAKGLEQLDLTNVEPLSHAADLEATLAEDVPGGELPREALEGIAPSMDGPFIRVPKVLGGGGGQSDS